MIPRKIQSGDSYGVMMTLWNQLIDHLYSARPVAGRGVAVQHRPSGTVISALAATAAAAVADGSAAITTITGINNTSIAIPAGRAVRLVSVAETAPGGSTATAYVVVPALSAMLPWGVTMNEIPANGGRDLVITDGVITGHAANFRNTAGQNIPSAMITMDGTGMIGVNAFARIGTIAYSGDFAVTPLVLNENGTTTLRINAGALSINGGSYTNIYTRQITAPANFARVYLRLPAVGVDGDVEIVADTIRWDAHNAGGMLWAPLATMTNNCIQQRQFGPLSMLRVARAVDLGDNEP